MPDVDESPEPASASQPHPMACQRAVHEAFAMLANAWSGVRALLRMVKHKVPGAGNAPSFRKDFRS